MIPEGSIRRIAAFTGGLILLAALLRPVLEMDPEVVELDLETHTGEILRRQAELERSGKDVLEKLIAERTQAYISDKAAALGAEVSVRVTTETWPDGVPLPAVVYLDGPRSQALADWIAEELGIPVERQVWNGENTEN